MDKTENAPVEDMGSTRGIVRALGSLLERLARSQDEVVKRHDAIGVTLGVLSSRGIDGESLLRYGMTESVLSTLAVWLVFEPLVAGTGDEARPAVDLEGWRRALQLPAPATIEFNVESEGAEPQAITLHGRIQDPLRAWLEEAALDDVLFLKPPTQEQLDQYRLQKPISDDVRQSYRWLHQRLGVKRLEDWDYSALLSEFKWREGTQPPPVSEANMAEAEIPTGDLNYEIARRAVSATTASDGTDQLFAQLYNQSLVFLGQSRNQEAAALFEFYLRNNPDHVHAENNLAFCLIPEKPADALHYLKRLEKRSYKPLAINIYNQMCCLVIAGREVAALERAEYYWQRELESSAVGGSLWKASASGWVIFSTPDSRLALAKFAAEIAKLLKRKDRMIVWEERIEASLT